MTREERLAERRRLWAELRRWPWITAHPLPAEMWTGQLLVNARLAMHARRN